MHSFLVALQFLTRLQLVKQDNWTVEDFGRSTGFFPLVGMVLGMCYLLAAGLLLALVGADKHFTTAALLLLTVVLTGGLHFDGFMDTMDGLLSGRGREKMLEIMRDSRTGAYGALSAMCLLLMEYAMLRDISPVLLPVCLFVMPVIGRMGMVLAIALFPYARPEGLGKAFSEYADRKTVLAAGTIAAVSVLPWGPVAIAAFLAGLGFAVLFARQVSSKLGGLTGDVYGATELLTEAVVLFVFMAASWLPGGLQILWR